VPGDRPSWRSLSEFESRGHSKTMSLPYGR